MELWLDMGMPGAMMMGMGTKLAIYAPARHGDEHGHGRRPRHGRDGHEPAAWVALIGRDSFFDWVFTEISLSGKFGEDGGYIGLRTAMGNFGWLHMLSQSDIGTDTHSVTFDGWAYEDQPGIAIAAGEGGPCDWKPGSPHKMHWPQLPDLGFTGIDISRDAGDPGGRLQMHRHGPHP